MMLPVTIDYEWRKPFQSDELNQLHTEGFDHRHGNDDWNGILKRLSLGWVTARDCQGLIGFVNVIWDGQLHAFIEDTLVANRASRQGIGTQLITTATEKSRAAGCKWLHVDFEDHLKAFYFDACGFRPTNAGLVQLR